MQTENHRTAPKYSETAAAAAALIAAWIILPVYGQWITASLWAVTLGCGSILVWHLLQRSRATACVTPETIPDVADRMDAREFDDFVLDGIAKSQLRGRTAALMSYRFAIPPSRNHFAHRNFDQIVEEFRDMTRAYDRVHNAGGGEIKVFLAHLPLEAEPALIAARLLDDVRLLGGAANLASHVDYG